MPDAIKSSCTSIYADATKIYKAINSALDSGDLQQDLNSLLSWTKLWQLKVNPTKSHLLSIPNDKFDSSYFLDNVQIESQSPVRDLGIMVQDNLKFSSHVQLITRKAFATSRNIRLCFVGHNIPFYVNLYKTYVRPQVESNMVIFNPISIEDITRLESVQRKFTKFLPGFYDVPYRERIFRLDLETLEERRI